MKTIISHEHIYSDPVLSDTDKLTCAAIASLSIKEGYCYAGNEYLARMFDRTFDTLSEAEQGKRIEAIRRRIRRLVSKNILKNIGTQRVRKLVFVLEDQRSEHHEASEPPEPKRGVVGSVAFDDFWARYPRRDGKKVARKVFDNLNDVQVVALMEALPAIAKEFADRERGFIPLPATFLRQERWEDEVFQKKIAKKGAAEDQNTTDVPKWVHEGLGQIVLLGDGDPEDEVLFGEGRQLAETFGMSPGDLATWVMDYDIPEFWREYHKRSASDQNGAAA